MDFPYGRSRLHKLLKKMRFSFKFRGKERLISERSDIIAWRERYLRAIKKFRENNPDKDIVYTDETWLNRGGQVHVKAVSHVCHKISVFGKKI